MTLLTLTARTPRQLTTSTTQPQPGSLPLLLNQAASVAVSSSALVPRPKHKRTVICSESLPCSASLLCSDNALLILTPRS